MKTKKTVMTSGLTYGKEIGKVACLYLCTIIGAGFATGREIRSFFTIYGAVSFFGVLFATLLLAFLGIRSLQLVRWYHIETLPEFNTCLAGPWLGGILSCIMSVFLYCLYVILLAGVSDLLREHFGMSPWITVAAVSVLSLIVLFSGFDKLFQLCTFAAPVIALGIAVAAILSALHPGPVLESANPAFSFQDTASMPFGWLLSAVLYASYNGLLAVPILAKAESLVRRPKVAFWGGLFGALLVGGGAMLVNWSLRISDTRVENIDMPLVYLAAQLGTLGRILFPLLVAGVMTISAVSGLSACSASVGSFCGFRERIVGLVLAVLAVPLSSIGFGKLMDFLYPAFGVAGILLIILLVFKKKKM